MHQGARAAPALALADVLWDKKQMQINAPV